MHYLPQEVEAWYIIPAIRREISQCLVKDFGSSYEKVGKILGISKAAISQYSKGKRAAKIKLPKEISKKIMSACKILAAEKGKAVEEISKILEHIRDKSLPCHICGALKEGVLEDCTEIRFKEGNYNKFS